MGRNIIRVYIQGRCFEDSIRYMLATYDGLSVFKKAKSIQDADMILYTGGSDIDPELYKEKVMRGTHVDLVQDKQDMETFRIARAKDKFQVGICRGAQFLNVVNGGRLWQDVDNHAGTDHLAQDCLTKKSFFVSSLHHQGIILSKDAVMLAYAQESTQKKGAYESWTGSASSGKEIDVEAFWYPKARCLGVQWHPELMTPTECVDKFFDYVEKYIVERAA